MFMRTKGTAPCRERKGLVSHFLLDATGVADTPLAVTWVEVDPGARQLPHHHPQTQVYVIISGSGLMRVGDEVQPVGVGDLVYVPSNAQHGIENTGNEMLSYVSAATPVIDLAAAYDRGPHTPDAY